MKRILFIIALAISNVFVFSQNITARIIDNTTKEPIQFATIKTGAYSGVISNDEGYFTINGDDIKKPITISCMGYQNKVLSISEIKQLSNVIPLTEAINQLNEVYISNKTPNADSIIAKAKSNLKVNYKPNLNRYNIFSRNTDYVDFKSLDFEIEKAKHVKKSKIEDANRSLANMGKQIIESNIVSFSDFKGALYVLDKDSSKIHVDKATKLLDYKNDFSIDNIQEKAQDIVLTYLDTTKTYKLKTGIFKIEDSLSLKSDDFKNDEENIHKLSHLNNHTRSLWKRSQFYKSAFLSKFLNGDLYEYAFKNIGYNNNELNYIIEFTPRKGKSKHTGTLYISDDNYAITRVDYNYYKNRHGEKFNLKLLLGVKYIENTSEGTIIYQKDSSNLYHPKYIKLITGSYFFVSRGLKFIENSPNRYKINFDFKLEGDFQNKEELLITTNNDIDLSNFSKISQEKEIPIKVLNRYEKTLWENEETLEPLKEMKEFKTTI